MNNFVVDIDGRAIGFERQFHDVYRAHDTGAKAAGPHPEQDFTLSCVLHGHPSLTQRQALYHTSAARPSASDWRCPDGSTGTRHGEMRGTRAGILILPTLRSAMANICRKSA